MSVTWAGQNTAVNLATTSSVGTGATGTPVGPAGGDLQGSYPNPTVHRIHGVDMQGTAPADLDMWQYHAANNRWRHRTWSQTMTDNGVTAAGLAILDDADAAAQRTTLGLGSTDTPTFAGINLASGEFISNSSNGRVDIGPDGIDPASPAEDFMALTIDGTWGFGVFLGTRNTRTDALNTGNILFQVPLILNNDTRFSFGSSQNYFIRHVSGSSRAGVACGLLVNNAGSTGSFVLAQGNQVDAANRIPLVAHTDPTLYIYAGGATNSAHFLRMNHDTTNGVIEAGAGNLNLVTPSGSSVNVNGNRVPTITSGTAAPTGGVDGDIYYRYQ